MADRRRQFKTAPLGAVLPSRVKYFFMEKDIDITARQAEVNRMLNAGIGISVFWIMGIILWPLAFGPLVSVFYAVKARKLILGLNGRIKGMWKVWWCFIVGGLELAATFAFTGLLILGYLHGDIASFEPSPDGRSVAALRDAELSLPAAHGGPVLLHKIYLRIQETTASAAQRARELRIDNEDGESYSGGLVWSPDSRKVAFTTKKDDARRLWVAAISSFKKSLVAGDIHTFRWEDPSHLVYVAGDGEIFRTAVSEDGVAGEPKFIFSAGKLDGAEQYAYHFYGSGNGFNNPLSPRADKFLYGDRGSLTAVNLASAGAKKSFPVLGLPVRFWWDEAGKKCLVESMEGTGTGYSNPPYHYYLYRTEGAALTLIASQAVSEAGAPGHGRLWFGGGRHFVLSSKYPAYMTWLVDTESLSAAWMESEAKKLKDGAASRLSMIPLPLTHLERDPDKEPLPDPDIDAEDFLEAEAKRGKMIDANLAEAVAMTPSPRGDSFLLWSSLEGKRNSVCRMVKLETDHAGSSSISVVKKIEIPDQESLACKEDGSGFLCLKDANYKFKFVSIF